MRKMSAGHQFDLAELENISHIFVKLALEAGRKILDVRAKGPRVRQKTDNSPVCEADEQAEAIIVAGLSRDLPEFGVVAEEAAAAGKMPELGSAFILVDPLDGTREFVADRDQFTVNIALVSKGTPILGVVYAPAQNVIWCGGQVKDGQSFASMANVMPETKRESDCQWQAIHSREGKQNGLKVLCSHSHMDEQTARYMQTLPITDSVSIGSSTKFCLIASGQADVYPRMSPTMEWDSAAGDAILRAAGGIVLDSSGLPLRYGKPGFRNQAFFAWGNPALASRP